MTNSNQTQQQAKAAAGGRSRDVPAVGAPRPFWQRWKEWERENGTFPAPSRERAF